jgi:hypothetical protein
VLEAEVEKGAAFPLRCDNRLDSRSDHRIRAKAEDGPPRFLPRVEKRVPSERLEFGGPLGEVGGTEGARDGERPAHGAEL